MTPAGLAALKNMAQLERLHLLVVNLDLRPRTLADILPENLESLEIGYTRLSIADMECIGRLKKLKTLRLWSTDLSDESINPLAKMRKLEVLEIKLSKLTDRSIEVLKRLDSLRELTVYYTEIAETPLYNAFKDRPVKVRHTPVVKSSD